MVSPRPFSIVPASTVLPDGVGLLAAEAEREGVRIVTTVVERWRDGSERFDRPGEALLVAVAGAEVVGIGGLSECPDVAGALRMRRFFAAPAWRRRGVARAIADELLGGERARSVTITCNARASAAAAPFWESLGFVPVDHAGITHVRRPATGSTFEVVAREYDRARPTYPAGVYDALGDLGGLRVLDVGAGTGIASRQLLERGADVIAVDSGERVLGRARTHTPELRAVVADGARLPLRDGSVDFVCHAQSWHWLDPATRAREAHRVLRSGGRWAGWWSHARADGEAWFDDYWSTIERRCPGTTRDQRDTDWGATVDVPELFDVGERIVVPWTRSIATDEWLTDQASHSYVAALDARARNGLLDELREILDEAFGSGTMRVPYETWMWIARSMSLPMSSS